MQIYKNEHIPYIKNLISGIFGKSKYLKDANVLVYCNHLIIIVMNTTIYDISLEDMPPLPLVAYRYGTIDELKEDEYIVDTQLSNYMISIYNDKIYSSINNSNKLLASHPELRGVDEFEKCISVKASDGAVFYKVAGIDPNETYLVPIFAGFPNLNKSDKIGISINQFGDTDNLLINFNIFKKKINRNINMYFRTINLVRRI